MSSNIFYDNIEKYLFQYVDLLEHSNSLGLTDKAVHAENLFTALLNLIFDWNLVNANEIKQNQSSFDLIYIAEKICIQITTNKSHKAKFNRSASSFTESNNEFGIDHFIVLFISKKVNQKLLSEQIIKGVKFESYDIPKLLRKIFYKCPEPDKLETINRWLEKSLNPVRLGEEFSIQPKLPAVLPKQLLVKFPHGIYIPRIQLVKELFDFIQEDSGLLIGGPGYGKSFIIEELQRYCVSHQIQCFIIRINDLTEGTNDEIGSELGLNGKWLESLINLNHSTSKSVLIFDAFDTAKDELLKGNILKFIKKSLKELSPIWHILVSVRTYDATKSRKLLELFPNKSIRESVSCRNFLIPELSEQELEVVFETTPGFNGLSKKCNPHLKRLLRTPYFLKLFEQILGYEKDQSFLFNVIETEEQLLDVFWINKIEDVVDKELFLSKLTFLLAQNESLVCDKVAVITETNSKVFIDLTSSGILEEVSVTRQKISFSHNILLDFSISKYLLKQGVDEQIIYIESNEKMPFIFRQSFIYFYTKLYKLDNQLFWKHYVAIGNKSEPLFRLLHQTTLNYVLINFYQTHEDLAPIFTENDLEKRGQLLRKVLEGIRFITKGDIREKDVDLLLKISANLHWLPLWELGFLIEKGIGEFSDNTNKSFMKKLSDASCNCLEFVLEGRTNIREKELLDRNGGVRGIENLCNTLPINLKKVKQLFSKILMILKEDNFPIDYFFHLANNIVQIYRFDSELASLIYETLYFHNEVSDKETNLGNGVVLALRSNRRQDYGMVYYGLENSFSDLLKIEFYPAMKVGISIINKISNYRDSVQENFISLKIGNIESKIFSDYSFYENDKEGGPSSHLFKIFEMLELKLGDQTQEKVGLDLIYQLIPEIMAASIWRSLLKLMIKYPKPVNNLAFDILSNPEFYAFSETAYEAGELIKVVWPYFSKSKRLKIEEIILNLKKPLVDYDNDEIVARRISRILNCIPTAQIATQAAKEIINNSKVVENIPIIQEGGLLAANVEYSSREELVKRDGFNIEDDLEMLYYSRIEEMEAFNGKFENKDTTLKKSDCKAILAYVEFMFLEAKTWPKRKKEATEYRIAKFVAIFSSLGEELNEYEQGLLKKIVLQYINDESYFAAEYEVGDLKRSWGGFSPSARTASVKAVLNLMHNFKEKSIEDLVLKLMGDNIQIVRFKSIHGLGYFWEKNSEQYWDKALERGFLENDAMCLLQLLRAVNYNSVMDRDRGNVEGLSALILLKMRAVEGEVAREIWQILIVIILKLVLYHESSIARQMISANLDVKELSRCMIFEIMNVIDPHSRENDYCNNPGKYKELIGIIMETLKFRFNSIQSKGLNQPDIMEDFKIIDHVIQHLFFTVEKGRRGNKGNVVEEANRKAFYLEIRPILNFIVEQSLTIESGFMIAHTGYYFMQLLNSLLDLEAEHILYLSNTIVLCAAKNGFTYDSSTLKQVVNLTERIIVDHKEILYKNQNFNNLIVVLDQFSNSGWQEAMEMTWRLKEAF